MSHILLKLPQCHIADITVSLSLALKLVLNLVFLYICGLEIIRQFGWHLGLTGSLDLSIWDLANCTHVNTLG